MSTNVTFFAFLFAMSESLRSSRHTQYLSGINSEKRKPCQASLILVLFAPKPQKRYVGHARWSLTVPSIASKQITASIRKCAGKDMLKSVLIWLTRIYGRRTTQCTLDAVWTAGERATLRISLVISVMDAANHLFATRMKWYTGCVRNVEILMHEF